jgi:hypothetical protein
VASFCSLLGVAPTFKLTSDEYQDFVKETLRFLWSKCLKSEPALVRCRALDSIRQFRVEDHHLAMLPAEVKID